jgi:hypothetical protein
VVGGAGQQRKGALEAAPGREGLGRQAQVPLARHQGAVAAVVEQLGEAGDPVVEVALVARLADLLAADRLGHAAEAGDVVVGAGEQHRPGRAARRGGVEVGEAQAGAGQAVEVGRGDLAAEGADVGEAQVVGDDDEEVGALGHGYS